MPLDIGLGIFWAIIISRFALVQLNWSTVVIAVIFALLPDADFLLYVFKQGVNQFSHEHRDMFHNPLVFMPIGFAILAPFSIGLACLFLLCSLGHFLHDSIGMGWGIRWAYPFSKRYYKFFSDKQGRMASNFLISWTPEEQREAAIRSGNPHWLKDYLKFSPDLLLELFIFIAAIAILFAIK